MKLTKRSFFIFTLLLVFAFTLTAVAEYNENPEFAQMVEDGELPPVEQRLPDEPMVIEPNDTIGEYGGTFHWAWIDGVWEIWFLNEPLIRTHHYTDEPIPNLAKEFTTNEDKSIWTFHLREGVKWSDGEEFTAEDILFWYEDLAKNDSHPEPIPHYLSHAGEPADIYAEDDYTLVIEFAGPNPLYIEDIHQGAPTSFPKHYLKQFHIDYGDEEFIEQKIAEYDVDSWTDLIDVLSTPYDNPDLPVLGPWEVVTDAYVTQREARWNPYYWKVDPEGNQLPYIEEVTWPAESPDEEVRLLQAMQGEVDWYITNDITAFPVLQDASEEGDYTVYEVENAGRGTRYTIYFNQNYQGDEAVAEMLRNRNFRHGVNYAIEREEIIDFIQMGYGEPRQPVVYDDHPAGDKELSSQKIERDLEKAREYLDKAGLDEKNEAGYRLLPNGEEFNPMFQPSYYERDVHVAELLAEQLKEVGINAVVRPEAEELWYARAEAGMHQMPNYSATGGMTPLSTGHEYFPISPMANWAPRYGAYYATDGAEGEPIPEGSEHDRMIEIYEKATTEPDEEKRNKLIRKAMEIHIDELWMIGGATYPPIPQIVSNRTVNWTENPSQIGLWNHFTFPEQVWIDE